jgi:predicted metal-dependent hydrolase
MTKVYTAWLLEQDPNLPIRAAKREDVSAWILEAVGSITDETVRNAWRKTGYSYYE